MNISEHVASTQPISNFILRSPNIIVGGDLLEDMPRRLEGTLKEQAAKHRGKVDMCIFWGGTNDIRCGRSANDAFQFFQSAIETCKINECKVVVLTVPEMSFETAGSGSIGANRRAFNDLVIANAEEEGYKLVDVASAIPYFSLSEEDQKKWYCDGLHFTRNGYSKVATMVVEVIKARQEKKRTAVGEVAEATEVKENIETTTSIIETTMT